MTTPEEAAEGIKITLADLKETLKGNKEALQQLGELAQKWENYKQKLQKKNTGQKEKQKMHRKLSTLIAALKETLPPEDTALQISLNRLQSWLTVRLEPGAPDSGVSSDEEPLPIPPRTAQSSQDYQTMPFEADGYNVPKVRFESYSSPLPQEEGGKYSTPRAQALDQSDYGFTTPLKPGVTDDVPKPKWGNYQDPVKARGAPVIDSTQTSHRADPPYGYAKALPSDPPDIYANLQGTDASDIYSIASGGDPQSASDTAHYGRLDRPHQELRDRLMSALNNKEILSLGQKVDPSTDTKTKDSIENLKRFIQETNRRIRTEENLPKLEKEITDMLDRSRSALLCIAKSLLSDKDATELKTESGQSRIGLLKKGLMDMGWGKAKTDTLISIATSAKQRDLRKAAHPKLRAQAAKVVGKLKEVAPPKTDTFVVHEKILFEPPKTKYDAFANLEQLIKDRKGQPNPPGPISHMTQWPHTISDLLKAENLHALASLYADLDHGKRKEFRQSVRLLGLDAFSGRGEFETVRALMVIDTLQDMKALFQDHGESKNIEFLDKAIKRIEAGKPVMVGRVQMTPVEKALDTCQRISAIQRLTQNPKLKDEMAWHIRVLQEASEAEQYQRQHLKR